MKVKHLLQESSETDVPVAVKEKDQSLKWEPPYETAVAQKKWNKFSIEYFFHSILAMADYLSSVWETSGATIMSAI